MSVTSYTFAISLFVELYYASLSNVACAYNNDKALENYVVFLVFILIRQTQNTLHFCLCFNHKEWNYPEYLVFMKCYGLFVILFFTTIKARPVCSTNVQLVTGTLWKLKTICWAKDTLESPPLPGHPISSSYGFRNHKLWMFITIGWFQSSHFYFEAWLFEACNIIRWELRYCKQKFILNILDIYVNIVAHSLSKHQPSPSARYTII